MSHWRAPNARLSPLNVLVALAGISEVAYMLVVFFGQSLHVEATGKHSLISLCLPSRSLATCLRSGQLCLRDKIDDCSE